MSQQLEGWLVNALINNVAIKALVGADSAGNPAIFPYHAADADERVSYPHITIARFGDATERGTFQDISEFATRMDCPRIALCVWSQNGIDECYSIYNLCDAVLRGANAVVSNASFSAYKVRRTHLRDDLFDDKAKAYHLHSEYTIWVQYSAQVA